MKTAIINFLLSASFLYLLFSFVSWNLNPDHWNIWLRGLFALAVISASLKPLTELNP